MAGSVYETDVKHAYTWHEKKKAYLLILLVLIGGFICTALALLYTIWKKVNSFIQAYTQITFWFLFYCTKYFNTQDKEKLELINKLSHEVRNTNSIEHRLYRYCTGLLNKRNHYIYDGWLSVNVCHPNNIRIVQVKTKAGEELRAKRRHVSHHSRTWISITGIDISDTVLFWKELGK